MDLETWLKKNEMPVIDFADAIGYSRQRIYQIINKERTAGADLIRAIRGYTKEEVSVESLLYPEDPAPTD